LKNIPFACNSGIGSACEENYGGSGGLSQEVLSGGFYCTGVVVLSHKWDDSKGINFEAHSS